MQAFIRFVTNPYKFIKSRIILSEKIKNQIRALYIYHNTNFLLEKFIKEKNYINRKIFYLRNNIPCGNILKKVYKLLFY